MVPYKKFKIYYFSIILPKSICPGYIFACQSYIKNMIVPNAASVYVNANLLFKIFFGFNENSKYKMKMVKCILWIKLYITSKINLT